MEREKARTYWEVGGLIQAHLLVINAKAAYGDQVIGRLAKSVGISVPPVLSNSARAFKIDLDALPKADKTPVWGRTVSLFSESR